MASTAVAENIHLAQEKNVLVKENDALKVAIKAQQASIDDHKLQVAEAHCDREKLRSELETERNDHEYAFHNAQEAIANLESELEELQESLKQEQAEEEMQRLLNVCAEDGGKHQLASNPNNVNQAQGDLMASSSSTQGFGQQMAVHNQNRVQHLT